MRPRTDVPDPETLSAVDQKATDDESGTNRNEMSQCVGLPLSGQIGCFGCRATGRPLHFIKENQFDEHVKKEHSNLKITWMCLACQKKFERLLQVSHS